MRKWSWVLSGVLAMLGVATLNEVSAVTGTARRLDAERQEMERAEVTASPAASASVGVGPSAIDDAGTPVRVASRATAGSGTHAARASRGARAASGGTPAAAHRAARGRTGWAPDVEVLPPIVITAPEGAPSLR